MRLLPLFLLAIISTSTTFGCASIINKSTINEHHYNSAKHYYALHAKEIMYVHIDVDSTISDGDWIVEGASIGKPEPLPSRYSDRFHDVILNAEQLYTKKEYEKAIQLLLQAYKEEPNNPFLLNNIARSMYWLDNRRPDSFMYYRKLITTLDAQKNSDKDMIVIDLWFPEAYWKLGTLHLDRGEYEKGAFEITRAMVAGINKEPQVYEQALGYLTEAYFNLGKHDLAKYFCYQTLKANPSNQYVLGYLKRMHRQD